ncbi:MAG: hypothetical protein SPE43_05340 [Ruminococcus sp.]|nr:hypothetical protein [Ruminococcus sp.]
MNPDDAKTSSIELTANINNPLFSALSLVTGYELGESDEYLVSIINGKDVDKLEYGESVCIFSPTGSGKTNAIVQIAYTLEKQEK